MTAATFPPSHSHLTILPLPPPSISNPLLSMLYKDVSAMRSPCQEIESKTEYIMPPTSLRGRDGRHVLSHMQEMERCEWDMNTYLTEYIMPPTSLPLYHFPYTYLYHFPYTYPPLYLYRHNPFLCNSPSLCCFFLWFPFLNQRCTSSLHTQCVAMYCSVLQWVSS